MVKFMKFFRKVQKKEWEKDYIDYKSLKHFIKENINDKNFDVLYNFTSKLDNEIRKIFVFYMNQESKIYISINQCLHNKKNYHNYDEFNLFDELNILAGISVLLYDLIIYIKYNIQATEKILKKFDKKFYSITQGTYTAKYYYSKITDEGSDLNYIFKFKIVNEVISIINELSLKIQTQIKNLNRRKTYTKNDLKTNEQINVLNKEHKILYSKNNNENNLQTVKNNIQNYIKIINLNQGKIENPYRNLENTYKLWKIEYSDISDLSTSFDIYNSEDIDNNYRNEKLLDSKVSNNDLSQFFIDQKIYDNSYILYSCFILYGILEFLIITDDHSFIIKNTTQISYKKMGITLISCPLGMISLNFTAKFIKINSFKSFLIFSLFFSIIGSILYCFDNIFFKIAGRFLIGLSLNEILLKKYIIQVFPNKKIRNYFSNIRLFSIFGKIVSRLIVILGIYIKEKINEFSTFFYSSIICAFFSFIILIIIISKFKVTIDSLNYTFSSKEMTFYVNNNNNDLDSKLLNEKMNRINIEHNNDNADLVAKSIEEIIKKTHINNIIIFILLCLTYLMTFSTFHSFLIYISNFFALEKKFIELFIIVYWLIILIFDFLFTNFLKKINQPRSLFFPLIISNVLGLISFLFKHKFMDYQYITYILFGFLLLMSILLNILIIYLYEKLIVINYKIFSKFSSVYVLYLSGIIGMIIGYGNIFFFINKEIHLKMICIIHAIGYLFIFIYTLIMYKSLKIGAVQRLLKMEENSEIENIYF